MREFSRASKELKRTRLVTCADGDGQFGSFARCAVAGKIFSEDAEQVIARRKLPCAQQARMRKAIADAIGDDVLEARRRAIGADAAAASVGNRDVRIIRRQAVEFDVDERLFEPGDRRAVLFNKLITGAVQPEFAAGDVAVDAIISGYQNLHIAVDQQPSTALFGE